MTQDDDFLRACFEILTGSQAGDTIDVHFNPVSLQYQVQNTMQQQGGGAQQYVTQSTGKLTMDLVFDTTHDGTDVRNTTIRVARLMQPENRIPPVVRFDWGAYKFEGTVESYKETIDFFSPDGVPLRASLNLTLAAKTEQVFAGGSDREADLGGSLSGTAVQFPSPDPRSKPYEKPKKSKTGSPSDAATRAGKPGAARAVGAMNGAESLRFGTGGSLNVAAGVKLGAPVAFSAGAGAGLSLGAGAGIGIGGGASAGIGIGGSAGIGIGGSASAGIGIGGSAGIGIGGGASAGIGIGGSAGIGISGGASAGIGIGGSASAGLSLGGSASAGVKLGGSGSAGVSASAGAFAGLSIKPKTSSTGGMQVTRLVAGASSAQVATDAGASFAVGGRALVQGNASLRADVGASASLKGKLTWDGG